MFFEESGIIFAKNLVITKQMGWLRIVECDFIHNHGGFVFHKLHQGESCQFDEFLAEIKKNNTYWKEWTKILRWMENYGTVEQFPAKYYKNIKGLGRSDIYEYKNKALRIYVKVEKPNVIIILGGYKQNQKLDIQGLKYKLKKIDLL